MLQKQQVSATLELHAGSVACAMQLIVTVPVAMLPNLPSRAYLVQFNCMKAPLALQHILPLLDCKDCLTHHDFVHSVHIMLPTL
jgi:hypothetical protein